MKNAIIIHGTGGNPEGNWFPWMREKLEQEGFQVIVPNFPTPENQSLVSWKQVFKKYEKHVNLETVFIAHSVGPSFVCSILEDVKTPIKACYFVSGFLGNINIPDFDILNDSFINKDFNWNKIKNSSEYMYMCHGINDPYVSLENAQKLAYNLGIKIDIIDNGGHLNSESGYSEFEYLYKIILGKMQF